MQNFLPAILEALSAAAGPLGFPGKFVLKLYEDQKAGDREIKLKQIITEGHSITKQSIEGIYEIKDEMSILREQLVYGILSIVDILSSKGLPPTPRSISDEIPNLNNENHLVFSDAGFVTEKMLVEDLADAYAHNPGGFIQILHLAGFDIASIPHGLDNVLRTTVFHFLKVCKRRYSRKQQEIFFSALAEDNPNSISIGVYFGLLNERNKLE